MTDGSVASISLAAVLASAKDDDDDDHWRNYVQARIVLTTTTVKEETGSWSFLNAENRNSLGGNLISCSSYHHSLWRLFLGQPPAPFQFPPPTYHFA